MIHTLRFRLLLLVGMVVVAALTFVGVYSSRVASVEFQKIEEVAESKPLPSFDRGAVVDLLRAKYTTHGHWGGVAESLAEVRTLLGEDWSAFLFDSNGSFVGSTHDAGEGAEIELTDSGSLRIATRSGSDAARVSVREIIGPTVALESADGSLAGTLCLMRDPGDLEQTSPRERFAGAFNRSLLWGVALVGVVALVLTSFLAGRMLGPIEELTSVARTIAEGDLSRRVSIETKDEVGALAHAFNSMAEGLERIERLRRNMVSEIAHELRTPLTNVRCQLESVQDGLVEMDPGLLSSLHEEILLLSDLVEDLQDLAMASAGQLEIEREDLSLLVEVQRAVTATVSSVDRSPGVNVEVDSDLAVEADSRRLQQIVRNLLKNALAHTPSTGRVEVGAKTSDRYVEVWVRDSGSGITAMDLPYVFERFYRTDPSRSRETGGAGLGLAIVKQLVEAHGGEVGVESVAGEGSRFWFRLPRGR